MSKPSDKPALVAKVVEVLYSEMLSAPIKVKEDWPDHVKERMLETRKTFQENHRKFSIELYEKYMTAEQLQALLDFQTSDMGKSIKEAQNKINIELSKKYKELEAEKEKSKPTGLATVRSRIYIDDDDQDS